MNNPWNRVERVTLDACKLPAGRLYGIHFRDCTFRDMHGGRDGRYVGIELIGCVFERSVLAGDVSSFVESAPYDPAFVREHAAAEAFRAQAVAFYRRVTWALDARLARYTQSFASNFLLPLAFALGPKKVRLDPATFGYVTRKAASSAAIRRTKDIAYNLLAPIDTFRQFSREPALMLLVGNSGRGAETALATLARLKDRGFATEAPPRGVHRWPPLEPATIDV